MSKEKLNKIAEMVYKATIIGNLKWELDDSIFNSDTVHKYKSLSADGITIFSCKIILKKNLSFDKNNRCSLDISNPNIVDNSSYLWSDLYPIVMDIQEWIYRNNIKSNIKLSNQESVMDDILSGIDVSEFRDQKIETILNKSSIIEEKKDQKKSFLKKLFGSK
jgi:hypothetical protein